ncbi:coiled-coil domain-containing protein 50 isoform X1 [Calypte anna]|uniref:coiled-coil domain-containing protein 50 isoform X1 n=1 Tax=Calypte anna TaxID=9244 RepID=UPI0011C41933|nr:coiled-coil domain-containing protein 50 isoform X1 [Calypte anna]
MAGIGIDHSKLSRVKEVCRDFAVLEDHTLAHNLQEQEIEHHLATNVQRNRLVQHDLRVAKQLQEEEDLKARAQIQKHQKDLERQDSEIAQEIQVKLVFEAEQRRRQEENDEDIARLLQQRELQEEKKRKKHYSESQGHTVYEDSYYAENGEHPWGDPREQVSEPGRARSGDGHARRRREHWEAPSPLSCGTSKHGHSPSEHPQRSQPSEASYGYQQERKYASQGRSRRPPSLDLEREAEHGVHGHSNRWEPQERRAAGREKARRPSGLDLESERGLTDQVQCSRKPARQDRKKHLPLLEVELEAEQETWHQGGSQQVRPEKHKSRHQGHSSHGMVRDERFHDAESRGDHRRGKERGCVRAGHRRRSPSPPAVTQGKAGDCQWHSGTKQAMYDTPQREQELSDAEMARKLQEEELLASEEDQKAAQVAQDEEIARLLMAEEKKAFKKGKEREKSSFEKRRHDQDWKHDVSESTRSRSKEGPEAQRHKGDRSSSRSQPHLDDHARYYTSQPSPLRQIPKPEQSPRGSHRKQ